MRIVLLHHSAPPVVGGVESVLGHHARLISSAGHAVSIVAARGEQIGTDIPFISIPLVDSRDPHILAAKDSLDRGKLPPQFPSLVAQLVEALSTALEGADRVIAHNVCSLNKNLALTAALHELSRLHKPGWLVLWHHDLAWTTPRYRNELYSGYPWDLLRTPWPNVVQVTISEFRQEELAALMGIPREKIHVIPNGVDLYDFLKLEEQTAALDRQLGLSMAFPLLLLPVRITPRKNIELALNVAAALRNSFPEIGLLVTGPLGPHNPNNATYFQMLKELRAKLGLESSVHFLAEVAGAPLPDTVVGDLYRLADALFLPSREEGFGIPVLEAGLTGLPAFCADISPLRELAGAGADFFPLEARPAQIAAMIQGRLESSPVFHLRRRVRREFTWERIYAERLAPLLEEA